MAGGLAAAICIVPGMILTWLGPFLPGPAKCGKGAVTAFMMRSPSTNG